MPICWILGTVMQIIKKQKCDRFKTDKKHWMFAFIAVLVFKLLSREVLFIVRKDNRNC